MTPSFSYQTIPESRIATFDTFSAGMLRHHVAAILNSTSPTAGRSFRSYARTAQTYLSMAGSQGYRDDSEEPS
ncbi:MAG: hypothetical protein IPJ37_17890 [Bacteroidales bacterium]|nr:hypothetical protein [Bacteroidales bacterium]